MQITANEIAYKKKIGTLDSKDVWEIGLIGGLHLLVSPNGTKVTYLGAGPHRGIARHIARKSNPDLIINELSKADHIEPSTYQHLLPFYETLTDKLNG